MKTRDHNQAAEHTGQPEGAQDLSNPQVGSNPKAIRMTRERFKRISNDYKSTWTRPDGTRVPVVMREADGGGVQFVEVELIKE